MIMLHICHEKSSQEDLLLTRWIGTCPAVAAEMIRSALVLSKSSPLLGLCRVAARTKNAFTSEYCGQRIGPGRRMDEEITNTSKTPMYDEPSLD